LRVKEDPNVSEPNEVSRPKGRAAGRVWIIGGAFVAGFILFVVAATQVWEYSNSTAFCAGLCHFVHHEEPAAYQDSYHASVKCTECHMGRVSTLRAITLKVGHFRDLAGVVTGNYTRPTESTTLRPPAESCERCHWPPAFHGDRVTEIKEFLPDKDNTLQRIYLILKTGGGERAKAQGFGIHWHIANGVEYVATGEQRQDIRWVRTTLPDGRTVEYNDVTNPLSADEIARLPKRSMDCVDCHNRAGHPFPDPDRAVDAALADGRLNPKVPYLKGELRAIMSAGYTTQQAGLQAVKSLSDKYKADYPEAAAQYGPDIDKAEKVAEELLPAFVFRVPGVTWESFPDNGGHRIFPGCFRCHDGKHLTAGGESIRLHCNICHAIPVTVGATGKVPEMPMGSVQEPASHLETNFIANHRTRVDDSCAACHGKIAFGSDNSNFCANPQCHGRPWPAVNLDAAKTP